MNSLYLIAAGTLTPNEFVIPPQVYAVCKLHVSQIIWDECKKTCQNYMMETQF